MIADIKTVSLGNKQLYRPGMQGDKAVQLRAVKIQGEYSRIAQSVDRELGQGDKEGPTLKKLRSFPPVLDLVFGAYGECSEGVKKLMDSLVSIKLQSLGLRKGVPGGDKELSQVTSYLRRRLSSAVMQANVRCLQERLIQVGEGFGQAGRRRRLEKIEQRREKLDREAQWMARVTGRRLVRTGDFLKNFKH